MAAHRRDIRVSACRSAAYGPELPPTPVLARRAATHQSPEMQLRAWRSKQGTHADDSIVRVAWSISFFSNRSASRRFSARGRSCLRRKARSEEAPNHEGDRSDKHAPEHRILTRRVKSVGAV